MSNNGNIINLISINIQLMVIGYYFIITYKMDK